MTELTTLLIAGICFASFVAGVVATLLFYRLRSGTASPQSLRDEMENYQTSVEAHFDETSRRFKEMTKQYQELYDHLSMGATTLCRPEQITHSLNDHSVAAPEKPDQAIEPEQSNIDKPQ